MKNEKKIKENSLFDLKEIYLEQIIEYLEVIEVNGHYEDGEETTSVVKKIYQTEKNFYFVLENGKELEFLKENNYHEGYKNIEEPLDATSDKKCVANYLVSLI